MTDEEFNKYCAEVMNGRIIPHSWGKVYYFEHRIPVPVADYLPSKDLNQMAEVFDKLVERGEGIKGDKWVKFSYAIGKSGIAQAMREFIESTKEESE